MPKNVVWRGNAVMNAVNSATKEALKESAEHILDESNKIVPHDEGNLEGSGNTNVDGNTATVTYDASYALTQHEDMTLTHKNGRQAKYLETALKENHKEVVRFIANKIKSEVK